MPESYHITETGNTFQVSVKWSATGTSDEQEKVIAFGVKNDPAILEEVTRLVAHANISLSMQNILNQFPKP